jgi:hypothetical protein
MNGGTVHKTNNKIGQINIDTIEPFTRETFDKRVAAGEYTLWLYESCLKGLVNFIEGIIIKGDERNYAVTDPTRNSIHRLEYTRMWVADEGGIYLNELFDSLQNVNEEHHSALVKRMDDAHRDDKDATDNLIQKLKPIYFGIKDSKGDEARKHLLTLVRTEIKKLARI